ncbi:EF-hand calcium-binding domain-containing protein 5 [Frankliniella fusca]|uniref:EF-hand calcium-binding domain-containing protein 5 n=1 Tax=Frankliniella fusca TaxID=407009 RepID=A0AAE1HCK5_9NEOP|nr:EF-hand calcium-binding domain-containing protein 5 [Frankliniella fusca]
MYGIAYRIKRDSRASVCMTRRDGGTADLPHRHRGAARHIRPAAASGGQRRPAAASGGQRRPAAASGGQRRPAAASGGQRRPAAASGGQRRPAAASGGQRRPAAASGGQRRPARYRATISPAPSGLKRPIISLPHRSPWRPWPAGARATELLSVLQGKE